MSKNGRIIKAFFFDLDGTLCDTDEANYLAYKKAFKTAGFELKRSDFDRVNGNRADKFMPVLIPGISEEEIAKIREQKAVFYARLMHKTKPNKELIDFMNKMRPHHQMVLVTTAAEKNAHEVLKQNNLLQSFDKMIFGEYIARPKPAPDVYLLALKEVGLEKDEVVVFEDSQVGIEAATKAGLQVIKVIIS
jgi:HAD superfamily hydrolase (TIGR01509 family)